MLSKIHIKHFAKVSSGQGAPQRETDFSDDGIPFIRAGSLEDLLNGKEETELPKVNEAIAREYRLKLYQPNTIVFAKSGMSSLKGRIYKLKNPCYVVNHLATLELLDGAIPDYVVYTLRYFSPVKLINDNAYPSLKQSVIENFEVPFPKDKKVQLHIANLLSKAENLIAQRKESIHLLDEFLKSTFLEMFGNNTVNDKGWEKISLVDGCENKKDVKCGPFGTQLSKSEYQENGIPVWGIPQINSEFKILPKEYLTEKKALELDEYSVIPYDIVMSRKGNVGKCSLFPKGFLKGIIHSDVLRIRTDNKKVHPVFLLFQLKYSKKIEMQIKGVTKGAIMAGINVGLLKHIIIDQPPFELQTQFAQIVERIEALKTQYQKSLQELENLYGSLSQRAFRGELVSKKSEAKVITLSPETKVVQPELNKQQAFLRKLMLASHIINELCEESTFGHTKLMKLLYLSEQVGGMALQTNYKKFAAGPFDGKTLTLIDKEFEKNKWFAIQKQTFSVNGQQREATVYKRTDKSLLYKKHFDNYFESEVETINKIIALFRKEKTQMAEIVATLYFAWKELLTANAIISEDSLVKAFYQFHKEKRKFTKEQILIGYEYMQTNELYPQ